MNSFEKIRVDANSVEEIMNENQLRNKKKKLKKFLEKRTDDSDPELDLKIKVLESMIREYEHLHNLHKGEQGQDQGQDQAQGQEQDQGQKKKQTKNKRNVQKRKKKQEKEFLEREFQKNKDYWAKYEKEQKEKEEKERLRKEEEKRREREEWNRRNQSRQNNAKGNDYAGESFSKDKLFGDCEIKEIPQDLSELYDNYDKKMYKELSMKYHPDKSDYHIGYIKAVNQIKDKYNPLIVKNDETWQK